MNKYEKLAPINTGKEDRFFEVRARDFGWRCVNNGHAVVAVRDLCVSETSNSAGIPGRTVQDWLDARIPVEAKLLDLDDLRAAFGPAEHVKGARCTMCEGTGENYVKGCKCSCREDDCPCCWCHTCEGEGAVDSLPTKRDVNAGGVRFDANLIACALDVIARSVGIVAAWVDAERGVLFLRSDSLFIAVMRMAGEVRAESPIAIPAVGALEAA